MLLMIIMSLLILIIKLSTTESQCKLFIMLRLLLFRRAVAHTK